MRLIRFDKTLVANVVQLKVTRILVNRDGLSDPAVVELLKTQLCASVDAAAADMSNTELVKLYAELVTPTDAELAELASKALAFVNGVALCSSITDPARRDKLIAKANEIAMKGIELGVKP